MLLQQFVPIDPLHFIKEHWPSYYIYDKQVEIVYSVEHNPVTIVPACNKVGKDFIAGLIALIHFIRYPEVRVITTSVKDDHLRVLWAEIGRHVEKCNLELTTKEKKPFLRMLHRDYRKINILTGKQCTISYMRGMVSERGEGLAGHHAAWTLGIIDEASGVDDIVFKQMRTWAKRVLVIGNPLPTSNFFAKLVEEGDVPMPKM